MFGNSSKDHEYRKYEYHLITKDFDEQLEEQNKNLDLISSRVVNLKSISQSLHNELSEQSELLDDVGHEMDRVESKMNATMIKLRKVLRLTNDNRQWTMIGVLVLAILVVIVLFQVLP